MPNENQPQEKQKTKRGRGRPPAVHENGLDSRSLALAAARQIVTKEGASHLSFDRLAAVSGLAKGTLLYYFKKKENLLTALLEEHAAELESLYQQAKNRSDRADNADIDPVCAAFIEWAKEFFTRKPENSSFGLAIQLAFDTFGFESHPVNQWFQQRFEEAKSSVKNTKLEKLSCLLAIQGLFYMTYLRMGSFTTEDAQEVLNYLQEKLNQDSK